MINGSIRTHLCSCRVCRIKTAHEYLLVTTYVVVTGISLAVLTTCTHALLTALVLLLQLLLHYLVCALLLLQGFLRPLAEAVHRVHLHTTHTRQERRW